MRSPKVFPVQEPKRFNTRTGQLEPWMDMTPAAIYGIIEEPLLNDGLALALSPAPMIAQLKRGLDKFCDDDYLLLVGDTTAIAAAVLVASRRTRGRLQVLKWNRETRSYLKSVLEI